MPEGSRIPLLVQQSQQLCPGLQAGPVQPLVGASPVVQVGPAHTGRHTQQASQAAQVPVTGERRQPKEPINLHQAAWKNRVSSMDLKC